MTQAASLPGAFRTFVGLAGALAEAALGEDCDIRGFHDVMLGGGALPLPLLETRVDAWIAAQRG